MSTRGLSQTLQEYAEIFTYLEKRDPKDDRFGDRESHILRICSISSSSSSIVCGILALYMFGAIDYKKRVFRHQLIMFLIVFDLIKLAVLLIYPSRIQTKFLAYYNHNFCEIVGFFTSLAIEGADIAILSFAIHTGLLIFRPNAKVKNGNNLEGGLFKYRYYVYLISFLTPCVLLSLAFVDGSGYKPLTTWCYLPQEPRWYRLVLSWVPRYLIVITIVTIYVSIYYYVMKQYSIVGGGFKDIHNSTSEDLNESKFKKIWRLICKFYRNLKKVMLAILFPEMTMYPFYDEEEENDKEPLKSSSSVKRIKISDIDENGNLITTSKPENEIVPSSSDKQNNVVETPDNNTQDKFKEKLHRETYHQFQIRRLQIQKQMKSIFIYPISYIFLWSFPFILQCFEFNDADSNILWLNAVLAFFQPFNCTVDTMVFLYRERPWTITTARTDTNPLENFEYPRWKQMLRWLPLYGLPTLESNQQHYYENVQKQIEEKKLRSASNSSESSPGDENQHDFSKILAGPDIDFVKIPLIAATPKSTLHHNYPSSSFHFGSTDDEESSNRPLLSRHGSGVDPIELSLQQPDPRRRRSSKLSWFSSLSGGADGRRSSGNTIPQSRKKSGQSVSDISDSSVSPTSQLFPQSFTFSPLTNNNNNATNLPEISEQPSTATKSLRPQQSPTSPSHSNFPRDGGTSPSRISSSTSISQQLHQHHHALHSQQQQQQQPRNLSNAFGLTRRPSFFDNIHETQKKRSPFGDENKSHGIFDTGVATLTDKQEDRQEDDEDSEDLDFMDFLRKGPPV